MARETIVYNAQDQRFYFPTSSNPVQETTTTSLHLDFVFSTDFGVAPSPPHDITWDLYDTPDLIRFAQEIAALLRQKGVLELPNQFKLYL
jgi:hypothetical protein